ncbi:MAG: NUDIX hydrolase [Anaerolineales bacterium]|nr:NUDIX hydrolase [Anaerolineales bacterium]
MNNETIRPIAICIVRRSGDIFVFEARDIVKGETFYRPLGGGIEFGERADQAVRREMMEELGVALINLRQIGMLENIFTYQGRPGHEIVFIFEADFAERAMYGQKSAIGIRDNNEQFPAMWKPLSEFAEGRAILYPNGLLELVAQRPDAMKEKNGS